jgi:hypothetical protein
MMPLRLPLWFVTVRSKQQNADDPSSDGPGATFAFTSADQAIAFLTHGRAGPWKMHRASDSQELVLVVADLHNSSVSTIFVDPEIDGSGGHRANLSDLLAINSTAG